MTHKRKKYTAYNNASELYNEYSEIHFNQHMAFQILKK